MMKMLINGAQSILLKHSTTSKNVLYMKTNSCCILETFQLESSINSFSFGCFVKHRLLFKDCHAVYNSKIQLTYLCHPEIHSSFECIIDREQRSKVIQIQPK